MSERRGQVVEVTAIEYPIPDEDRNRLIKLGEHAVDARRRAIQGVVQTKKARPFGSSRPACESGSACSFRGRRTCRQFGASRFHEKEGSPGPSCPQIQTAVFASDS